MKTKIKVRYIFVPMPKENWKLRILSPFFESLKVECTMLSTQSTHLTRPFRLTIRPRLEYDGTNR